MNKIDKKSMVIGFLLAVLIFGSIAWKTQMDNATRYFCPRGLAAIALTSLDQFNVLRTKAGLSTISTNQMLIALEDKFDTLPQLDCETNNINF